MSHVSSGPPPSDAYPVEAFSNNLESHANSLNNSYSNSITSAELVGVPVNNRVERLIPENRVRSKPGPKLLTYLCGSDLASVLSTILFILVLIGTSVYLFGFGGLEDLQAFFGEANDETPTSLPTPSPVPTIPSIAPTPLPTIARSR